MTYQQFTNRARSRVPWWYGQVRSVVHLAYRGAILYLLAKMAGVL